jgi:hypothetical protein
MKWKEVAVVSGLALCFTPWALVEFKGPMSGWHSVGGNVDNLRTETGYKGLQFCTLSYQYGDDNGNRHTGIATGGGEFSRFGSGQAITVRYDPNHPDQSFCQEANQIEADGLLWRCGLLAALLLGLGYWAVGKLKQ